MLHSSEQLWPWLYRLYWNTALFVGVALALPQLWMGAWASQVVAASYLLASLLAFPLAQRYPKTALVGHLMAALGMLIWASHQPWGAIVPGWDREMVLYVSATLATLGLTVLAMFGGLWVMVAGLVLMAVGMPHPQSALYWMAWPGWLMGGLVGLAIFKGVHRLEAAQQELAKVALRDRQTGLSTHLALEADYERYQALASRSDQPLLLSYWVLRYPHNSAAHKTQLLENLAQVMREAIRQGDGVYHLEHNQFCGLHIGLVSGDELAERLSRRFTQAQLVWVVCNGLTLQEALTQAQALLYPSPSRPAYAISAVPKA
jgi:hypothetical protein